jgi:tRNA(Ile)-lysidine synthase
MLLQQFQLNLKTKFPFITASQKLLLAVSGGIDSVVMTDLFYKSGFDFAIAHCNFQLREEESIRDELFVRSLEKKYNKEVFVKRFNAKQYAEENKISIQEAARELRYNWFESVSNQQSTLNNKTVNYISIAHNADDNIETMLLFLFRGTGIHGLTGMTNFDSERKIIRPLLFATREQIKQYAQENSISWVEDSSNSSDKYTRNFFRHKIIPEVETQFENAKQNLLYNIKRFTETKELFDQAIELHKKKLLEYKGNEIHIPVLKLQKTKPLDTVLWEIIKAYNFHSKQIDEVKKLFTAENSSYVQSSTHRIIKNRNWLIIAPIENEESNYIVIEENDKQVEFKNGVLNFEKLSAVNYQLSTANSIAQFDAKKIEFPLLLRKWKQGDYFYPLGMQKKKKLNRFFIDEKLSALAKENVWVIEMDKKIISIISHRIDDRFKISPSTKEVLKINFKATPKH